MDVAATAAGETQAETAAIDPKIAKELEKTRKAALKTLLSTYKIWCTAIKSKDAKQIMLAADVTQDDTFLLAGGGLSALLKAITCKESDPKAAALYLLNDVLVPKPADEVPDDIFAPAGIYMRRCVAFVYAAVQAGHAACGMAPLLSCMLSQDAQQQYLAARVVRGIAAALSCVTNGYKAALPEDIDVIALRDQFTATFLCGEDTLDALLRLLSLGSAAALTKPAESETKASSKEKMPAQPSQLCMVELLRILRVCLALQFEPCGVVPLGYSFSKEDGFRNQQPSYAWLRWVQHPQLGCWNAFAQASANYTKTCKFMKFPTTALVEVASRLLTVASAAATDGNMVHRYQVCSLVSGCLSELVADGNIISLQRALLEKEQQMLDALMQFLGSTTAFVQAAVLRCCNDPSESMGAPFAAVGLPPAMLSPQKDDKEEKAAKAKQQAKVPVPLVEEPKLPQPVLSSDLLAFCRGELLPAVAQNPRGQFAAQHSDKVRVSYGECLLLEVYRAQCESMNSLFRLLLALNNEDKASDLSLQKTLRKESVLAMLESLLAAIALPAHPSKEDGNNFLQGEFLRDCVCLLVSFSCIDEDFRVFVCGIGIVPTLLRLIANYNVARDVASALEWCIHVLAGSPGRDSITAFGDRFDVPFPSIPGRPKVECSALETGRTGAPSEVVTRQNDTSHYAVAPLGCVDTSNSHPPVDKAMVPDVAALRIVREDLDPRFFSGHESPLSEELKEYVSKKQVVPEISSPPPSTSKGKQATSTSPPTHITPEPLKFNGPWIVSSDLVLLFSSGYSAPMMDHSESANKGKKAESKSSSKTLETPLGPFDNLPTAPPKSTDFCVADGVHSWPDRGGMPPLQLSIHTGTDSTAVTSAAIKDPKKQPPAAAKAKKESDLHISSPRANTSMFPTCLSDSGSCVGARPADLRLVATRLLSMMLSATDADIFASPIPMLVARALLDSAAEISLLAKLTESLYSRPAPAHAPSVSPRSPTHRRTSIDHATGVEGPSSPGDEGPLVLFDTEQAAVHAELVCRSALLLASMLPSSTRTIEELSVIGPILWDTLFSLVLTPSVIYSVYWWAEPTVAAASRRIANYGALERWNSQPSIHVALGDMRYSAVTAEPDLTCDLRQVCIELLRRAALCDAHHRVYDWRTPATPIPPSESSDGNTVVTSSKDASKPQKPAAPVVTSKDTKKPGGAKGGKEAGEATASVNLSAVIKPVLASPCGGPIVGIDWDCKTESIAARLSANILRLVPAVLTIVSEPNTDIAHTASTRANLLRLVIASYTVYRARDKLACEQVRCFNELRTAEALAARSAAEGAAGTEESYWAVVAANMRRSRKARGLFIYGTTGTLVTGSSKCTAPVTDDDATATTSVKKATNTAPSKGKAEPSALDDAFATKKGLLHAVECWYGGPLDSAVLLYAPPRLPSIHNLEKVALSGSGYMPTGAMAHAVSTWQAGADNAESVLTGRDGKKAAPPAKKGVAAGDTELGSDDRVIVLSEPAVVVPNRLWCPSPETARLCSQLWQQIPRDSSLEEPYVKSLVHPIDSMVKCLVASIIADVRPVEPSFTISQLSTLVNEAYHSVISACACGTLISTTLQLLAFETDPMISEEELYLATTATTLMTVDRHKGGATQSAAAEMCAAFIVSLGALISLEGLACPLPATSRGDVCCASARWLADFLRGRWLARTAFWGRALVRAQRAFTAEEAAAIEPALAVGTVEEETFAEGIVSVDITTSLVEEEFPAGRYDPVLYRAAMSDAESATVKSSPRWVSLTALSGRSNAVKWPRLLNMTAPSRRFRLGGITALHAAVLGRASSDTVKAYLFAGSNCNIVDDGVRMPVLASALIAGDYEVAKLLLEGGAEANMVDGMLNPMLKYAFCAPATADASARGNLERELTSASLGPRHLTAGIGSIRHEPLAPLQADLKQVTEMVQLLLSHGAVADLADADGNAALHWLSAGTCMLHLDVRIRSTFAFSLSSLRENTLTNLVVYLVAAGASVDLRNATGSTALHAAVEAGNDAACKILLKLGANPVLPNMHGHSSCHLAMHGSSTLSHGTFQVLLASAVGRSAELARPMPPKSTNPYNQMVDEIFRSLNAHDEIIRVRPVETAKTILGHYDGSRKTNMDAVVEYRMSEHSASGKWESRPAPQLTPCGSPLWIFLLHRYDIPVDRVQLEANIAEAGTASSVLISIICDQAHLAAVEARREEKRSEEGLQALEGTRVDACKPANALAVIDSKVGELDDMWQRWHVKAASGHHLFSRTK